jgi:hypothetical protein
VAISEEIKTIKKEYHYDKEYRYDLKRVSLKS